MTPSPFITAAALAVALDSEHPPVVIDATYLLEKPRFDGDYRSRPALEEFQVKHLPGAMYVDVQAQFSDPEGATHYTHPEPGPIVAELARLGIRRHTPVVVYDTIDTMFAARLWYLLTWVGMNARVLDGGLAAWEGAGFAVVASPAAVLTPVDPWVAEPAREAWITKDELLARSEADARPLVCGLPVASFAGTAPTRYSRRGHIPGSVNVSSRDLFAPDGTVRGEAELREAYVVEGALGEEEVLLYCGGGISATANALTLAQLGVTAVRVYDGSLEEWSADESLTLELST